MEQDDALGLSVRNRIYGVIKKSPGLHFREIQRRTGLAVGSLQYHLDYLKRAHLIRTEKDGKFTRYYSIRGKQLGENTKIMSLLRQESVRKIVLFLLTNKRTNNLAIAKAAGLAPSTTSWHLDKLSEAGLIKKSRRGRKTFFYLQERDRVSELLASYRKSFLDEMVDNFAAVWDELGLEK